MIQTIPSYFNPFPVYYYIGGSPEPPEPDYLSMPFTIKSVGGTTTITLSGNQYSSSPVLHYSKNGNNDWSGTISKNQNSIILEDGLYVSLSGNNSFMNNDALQYNCFNMTGTGKQKVYGNIKSLINYRDENTFGSDNAIMACLFAGATNLIDASNLKLPYMKLGTNFYASLFSGCVSLTAAPELPAIDIAYNNCYGKMFKECKALSTGPSILPATTLGTSCYSYMFQGCTSLTDAPKIMAVTLNTYSLLYMFSGCASLSSILAYFPDWGNNSTLYWTTGVAANGVFTKRNILPSTRGENYIPVGWTINENIPINVPLTFIATDDNQSIALNKVGSPTETVMSYSKNGGAWTSYTYNDVISMSNGDTVAFSGANNGNFSSTNSSNSYRFITNGQLKTSGNIMSLLNFRASVPEYAFLALFSGASIVNPPLLPATKLAQYCYYGMFRNNSVLTSTPLLPATDATSCANCYATMFANDTGIISAAPISTAIFDNANQGMARMFSGCTSLVQMPLMNPLYGLGSGCCSAMFYNCTSLTGALRLKFGNEVWTNACDQMFRNCSNLVTLPSTLIGAKQGWSYNAMFQDCTSLLDASNLIIPTTGITNGCCYAMFQGCTALTKAPDLPATTLAPSCYWQMFHGCTALTTSPELPAASVDNSSYCQMFSGCTSLQSVPAISAQTVATSGMRNMFRGCSSLSSVKVAFTSWPGTDAYRMTNWLNGVANQGEFYCPTALGTNETITRDYYTCPTNWTVINT